ncbi:hypothetical protein CDD80_608 [Ophiocordyceps camponoti-rufipedis]|uniref:AB hydrolase-1 domain-containing protein n=1 Tax=Ophiocordyceps camponoti-rufipedis TaxID=2004952 RepID=A0A2C5XP01_9HYPO|nr:hypothetical protein CDD80_608 [Ophiocordyceps camponoti-rufipedis]
MYEYYEYMSISNQIQTHRYAPAMACFAQLFLSPGIHALRTGFKAGTEKTSSSNSSERQVFTIYPPSWPLNPSPSTPEGSGSQLISTNQPHKAPARDRDGEPADKIHLLPETYDASQPSELPASFRDLASYYRTPRGHHERATNTTLARGWDLMANFDAFAFNSMISPRPLLMITGSEAVTRWFSEEGVGKAGDPSEVFVVEGVTHAGLYDGVDVAGKKLVEFFGCHLRGTG